MTDHSPEYEALDRVVTADKRLRKFQYLLAALLFILVVWGGYSIQQNISKKIDTLVTGAVARNNARQAESTTISRETIRYITCIFVIPIDQRTPDTQQKCFEAADLPGGLTRSDFSPVVIPTAALGGVSNIVIQGQPSQSSLGALTSINASPESSTPMSTAQPENSQPPWAAAPSPTETSILQPAINTVQGVVDVITGRAQ
jgi:hypothetical protein